MKKLIVLFLALNVFIRTQAQNGIPFITKYTPETYNGESQIWDIDQAPDGRLCFGGNEGIYIFDGAHWNTIKISDNGQHVIRTIKCVKNRIYAGSNNEFGYFEAKEGRWSYISLSQRLDSTYKDFTDVWSMESCGKRVYFATRKYIFSYDTEYDTTRIIEAADKPFFLLQKVRNKCYIYRAGDGFIILQKDSIIVQNYGQTFAWSLLPYRDSLLIGFSTNAINIFSYKRQLKTTDYLPEPYLSDLIKFLNSSKLYSATLLNGQRYALGTIRNGVAIIDSRGRIENILTKKEGLPNNTVQYLFKDRQNNLWAGTAYGIARISQQFPIEIFGENKGVEGAVYDVIRFKDKLYLATNLGLYVYKDGKFQILPFFRGNHSQQVFILLPVKTNKGEVLLSTATEGLFAVKDTAVRFLTSEFGLSMQYAPQDSSQILFSHNFELRQAELADLDIKNLRHKKFDKVKTLKKFDFPIMLLFSKDNFLWIENQNTGKYFLYDLKLNQSYNLETIIPDSIKITAEITDASSSIIVTDHGLYTIDYTSLEFKILDNPLGYFFVGKNIVNAEKISHNKYIITVEKNNRYKHYLTEEKDGKLRIDSLSLSMLDEAAYYYLDGDSIIWFWSTDKVYKYRLKNNFKFNDNSKVLITKILINEDSVIYDGAGPLPDLELDYENNSITLQYALADFLANEKNTYSVKIEGKNVKRKERKWSKWSSMAEKEFNNLHEGQYTIKIKAKNAFGVESPVTELKIKINPPWQRSILAYISYAILLLIFIYLIVKINQKRLKQENERLEQIIKQRTAEIIQQKEEIQAQAENLKEINALLIEKHEEIQQQNEEIRTIAESLKQANEKITIQNKRITDSINYASKIQEAIFSKQAEIANYFPEHFILYKPKEIVSGDFYWFKRIDNFIILAVADCTGHGVPGAFMSMLAYAYLTEIATSRKINTAAKALDTLRELIINSLNKQEDDNDTVQRDGLDIALCGIDMETKTLQFAGAHNPLLIIRKNQLFELKADPMPVGLYRRTKPFSQKTIELQDKDKLYMFSDGYYDQFDKTKSRKFYRRNFYNLLLSISHKTMEEQKDILNDEFEQWKGYKNEQTDDVIVLGVEIDFAILDQNIKQNNDASN